MIRSAAIGLAALALAAPALAAEGGPIRGGEHDGFTRIVLIIEPTTEWSLETVDGRATLRFPGRRLDFGTGEVFDKIPRSRVTGVTTARQDAGTTVTVDLGCDCRVSTSFVGARYLALDIADRDAPAPVTEAVPAPKPAEDPEARAAREAEAVSTAEQILIRQIERAASQGLVRMHDPDAPPDAEEVPEETEVAEIEPAPEPAAPEPAAQEPTAPDAGEPQMAIAGVDPESALTQLALHDQVEATTVFDRDTRNAVTRRGENTPVASACLPDERLDVASWTNGLAFTTQVAALRRRLLGEFDTPDPVAVADLARVYIRFGFGAEAIGTLAAFGQVEIEDRAILADLARIIEGNPVQPDGPLAIAESCPSFHGLWLALGGAAPIYRDEAGFAAAQQAFEALPPDLRAMLAPNFTGRLLDAGYPHEARVIYDTAVRPGQPQDAALKLTAARLAAAEGKPLEAAKALNALIEADGHASVETLTELVRIVVDARLPVPDRVVTDLRAAALQYRGAPEEMPLRRLLVEALARQDALPDALAAARAAIRDLPQAADRFAALAVRVLAEADPARVGPAAYSETVLGSADLLASAPAQDPARTALASHLIALGLPDPALAALAPALAAGEVDARILAAKAHLRLGQGDVARETLGGLEGSEATELRARAFALDGDYDRALSTLADRGMPGASATYAWPSGDWQRASAAAPDPTRRAMADYMSAETGRAPTPAPAEDPDALAPEAAFLEPVPSLDRPTLSAARRLLSTGPKVDGFVQDLLAEAPSAPAPN